MRPVFAFAFLFAFPAVVYSTECDAGHKHKASLTGLTCATQNTNVASCDSQCCEKNEATCGGLTNIVCPWNQYAAGDAAWKNKAATDKTKNTVCCQEKVTCSNVYIVTPAGRKSKGTTVATKRCSSDAKSCAEGDLCFEDDTSKCLGWSKATACTGGNHVSGSDNTWKNKLISGNGQTACCAAALNCNAARAAVVCKAGKKTATVACNAGTPTADPSECQKAAACCIDDTSKCGGWTPANLCEAGTTPADDSDLWKNKAADATDKPKRSAACCVKIATCASATCTYDATSGLRTKKKSGVDTVACPGNAKSCGTSALCCETDTSKCGGFKGSIVCPYGFVDESQQWDTKTTQATKDAWSNKPANATNKNTNCCTPVAVCALPVPTGTTTPAPVVTTTPVATALKFSEATTTKESSSHQMGANMAWLGVGCFIGMSVLMVVQRLRSRMEIVEQADAREVDEQLLDDVSSLE